MYLYMDIYGIPNQMVDHHVLSNAILVLFQHFEANRSWRLVQHPQSTDRKEDVQQLTVFPSPIVTYYIMW